MSLVTIKLDRQIAPGVFLSDDAFKSIVSSPPTTWYVNGIAGEVVGIRKTPYGAELTVSFLPSILYVLLGQPKDVDETRREGITLKRRGRPPKNEIESTESLPN